MVMCHALISKKKHYKLHHKVVSFTMIILLTTVYQCYQYLIIIRETDLHKFDNLFLNPIEHCLSIYIRIIVC